MTQDEIKKFKDILETMSYTPLHPDWYYSSVHIDNLEKIQEELIALRQNAENSLQKNQFYRNIFKNEVFKHCPTLKEYLESVGLDQKFHRLILSTDKVSNDATFVHVDSYDPNVSSYSLNIPLIDCEDSYTIWYTTERKKLNDCLNEGMNPVINYACLPLSAVTEVKRFRYNAGAALLNTTILHKGYSDKTTRTICGMRFVPKLTKDDFLRLGIKNPYIQEE